MYLNRYMSSSGGEYVCGMCVTEEEIFYSLCLHEQFIFLFQLLLQIVQLHLELYVLCTCMSVCACVCDIVHKVCKNNVRMHCTEMLGSYTTKIAKSLRHGSGENRKP